MNPTLLFIAGFLCCLAFVMPRAPAGAVIVEIRHDPELIKVAEEGMIAAYNIGRTHREEDIGLLRLTIKDIEGMVR